MLGTLRRKEVRHKELAQYWTEVLDTAVNDEAR